MKNYIKTAGKSLSIALCFAYLTGCSDDDKVTNIPDNWITMESKDITCDHKKDTLKLDFTLASGLDKSQVYIVNEETSWCQGYIDNGQVIIAVSESSSLKERIAQMTLHYDITHAINLTLTQNAAPPTMAEDINISNIPTILNIGDPLELNNIITPIPANASYKTFDYKIKEENQTNLSINENGLLIAYKSGSYTFEVATIDGSNLKKDITIKVDTDFGRSTWDVDTSASYTKDGETFNYLPDGDTGKPEDMLDGDEDTFFNMIKPGKSYNGYSASADTEMYFVIDLGIEATSNSFYLQHRNNTATGLRVQELSFYGSNNGETFTEIQTNITIPTNAIEVGYKDLPESTYRYVKVKYTKWNTSSSNCVQIGEFNLARK